MWSQPLPDRTRSGTPISSPVTEPLELTGLQNRVAGLNSLTGLHTVVKAMNAAQQVVTLMLENQTKRVCSACEQEFGKQPVEPGFQVSHGLCRRHSTAMASDSGLGADFFADKPDDYFPPDMNMTSQ